MPGPERRTDRAGLTACATTETRVREKRRRSFPRRPVVRCKLSVLSCRLLAQISRARRQCLVRFDEVLHVALQFELVVRRLDRRRRRRWFVRRDAYLPVILEPGARRDQAAHRDVLLQAAQMVDLAGDGRLGEHARRFLERRRRDERVGRERRLRDAEEQRPALRRTPARRNHALVLLEEPELVGLLVDEE